MRPMSGAWSSARTRSPSGAPAENGAPGKIRTPDPPGRSRPLLSAELRGQYWSGCEVPPLVLRVPSAGLFCTSFTLLKWRSHEDSNLVLRFRRPMSCPFDHGTLGSGEVRRTTAACWLPSQESNLPELCLTGSRVHLARLRGMNWWTTGVTLPARVACKASLHPCAWPMVPE